MAEPPTTARGDAGENAIPLCEVPVAKVVGDPGQLAVELVGRIRAGEPAAESELVEGYRRGLILLLRRWTGDASLAEDLAHETLVATIQRLRTKPLDEPRQLGAFVRGIAHHLAIAHGRREARRRTSCAGDTIYDHADPAGDPAAQAELAQEIDLVRRLIGEMSVVRDRELLYRYYVAGERKEQICRDMNLDAVHFNRVLHRARKRLHEMVRRVDEKP